MMKKTWDTAIVINGYAIKTKVKLNDDGVYYAQADSFFLVATSGMTYSEAIFNFIYINLLVYLIES